MDKLEYVIEELEEKVARLESQIAVYEREEQRRRIEARAELDTNK